ncbi:hypothetical protein BDZ85DRAFT_297441 [Elsinoe ampelina]|uniref:Zinc finger C2H2 LYAR-type domain-containing protein n=1 Tax=Elsinoe ampelina TaxID=302913 RepID=A0A6A6G6X9_9PEZI|nr:hypothetical protein BDZ85DRAFT_297441 [Elsinoe ampelina]
MVSFSCEGCGDVLTKGKLDKHRNSCRRAQFTCIDCMTTFHGAEYKSHTSCISEAQKYEGTFYKEKDRKQTRSKPTQPDAMIPRKAYVEDDSQQDTEMRDTALATIDVPPQAPSPPQQQGPNVYDFLVKDESGMARSTVSDDSHYVRHGYSYGSGPLQPTMERYDSYSSLVPHAGSQNHSQSQSQSQIPEAMYLTPAPSGQKKEKCRHDDRDGHRERDREGKSDKKRKRDLEELDTSSHRKEEKISLHSGLTGGLSRLLARPVEELERQVAGVSPSGGLKRSKHNTRESLDGDDRRGGRKEETRLVKRRERSRSRSSSSEDRTPRRGHGQGQGQGHGQKAIEYRKTSGEANGGGQLVKYGNPGEMFLGFITKGEESQRGQSINKVLKRYHREREAEKERDRESGDKELWKELRVRRNERGEIVLFV